MKKMIIFALFAMVLLAIVVVAAIMVLPVAAAVSADDVLTTQRHQEGSDMYSYNFTKRTPGGIGRTVCGDINAINHPFANDLLQVPGVEWVSIKRYSIKISKAQAFSLDDIEEGIVRLMKKYLKVKKVIIVDK